VSVEEFTRALLDYMARMDAIVFHAGPESQAGLISRSHAFDVVHRLAQLCVIYHQRPDIRERHAAAAAVGLRVRRYQNFDCLEPADGFPQLAP
jgi:hypothetical protein